MSSPTDFNGIPQVINNNIPTGSIFRGTGLFHFQKEFWPQRAYHLSRQDRKGIGERKHYHPYIRDQELRLGVLRWLAGVTQEVSNKAGN